MPNNLPDIAYLYAFTLIPEIGPSRFGKITKDCDSFEEAWKLSEKVMLAKGVDQKTADLLVSKRNQIDLGTEYEQFQKTGFRLLSQNDEEYPKQLKEIRDAPFVLICHGDVEVLAKKQIAVVGTRMPTDYGKIATEKICQGLINAGLTITSGMANGVDTIAHSVAIENEVPTIAVLGEGLGELGRRNHAKKMVEKIFNTGGVVISEYNPSLRATKFTFPARNRIISGLSLGTLVAEAGEKSGSLITAHCALEQNREVFAIPGNISSPQSIGTNLLIRQGAQLVSSHNDILSALQFAPCDSQLAPAPKIENEIEKKIYSYLSMEPIHIDALAKKCAVPSTEIYSAISIMELRGITKNIGGGMFIRQ